MSIRKWEWERLHVAVDVVDTGNRGVQEETGAKAIVELRGKSVRVKDCFG